MAATQIIFSDVKDQPSVLIELPFHVPLGERLKLRFTLKRRNGNRTEELRVEGGFRVSGVHLEASPLTSEMRQVLEVEATELVPSWRAVKNPHPRKLAPTHTRFLVLE